MARKRNRFIDQAVLQALVRFGPEVSALMELQRQAFGTYKGDVGAARGLRTSVENAVDRATPRMADVYEDAGLAQARVSDTLIGKDLAGLSGVADSIKGGAALEQAGMADRLAEAKAASLAGLQERRLGAVSGEQYARQKARGALAETLGQIGRRRQSLAQEQGAFTASTAFDLRQADLDRDQRLAIAEGGWSQSERNSLRSAGIDPNTGAPIPGGKLDPKKDSGKRNPNLLSRDKHLETQNKVLEIQGWVDKWKSAKGEDGRKPSRSELAAKLRAGRGRRTLYVDPTTGAEVDERTPGARKVVLEAIPAYGSDLRVRAALDLSLDGHLSRQTQTLMRRAGFSLRELGLTTYGQWARARRRTGAARTGGT